MSIILQPKVIVDLSATTNTTQVTVANTKGTGFVVPAATDTTAGAMTGAQSTKLTGIAAGATANSTDAQLRDRTTHTGSQIIGTVTGLQAALDAKAALTQTLVIGSDNWLKVFARDYPLIISGTITRDANNVITTSGVVWPDGTTGVFTATTINTSFKCIDAYTVTYVGGTTKTITQSAVTRNANGYVTTYPAMTVA